MCPLCDLFPVWTCFFFPLVVDEDNCDKLSFCVFQQAFNATVAINHMKKLQLAHGEAPVKQSQTQTQLPDVKVISTSYPEATDNNPVHDNLEPNGNLPSSHMTLQSVSMETNNQYLLPKVSHSVRLTVAEKTKHVYHSEPGNLNGYWALSVWSDGKNSHEPIITIVLYTMIFNGILVWSLLLCFIWVVCRGIWHFYAAWWTPEIKAVPACGQLNAMCTEFPLYSNKFKEIYYKPVGSQYTV